MHFEKRGKEKTFKTVADRNKSNLLKKEETEGKKRGNKRMFWCWKILFLACWTIVLRRYYFLWWSSVLPWQSSWDALNVDVHFSIGPVFSGNIVCGDLAMKTKRMIGSLLFFFAVIYFHFEELLPSSFALRTSTCHLLGFDFELHEQELRLMWREWSEATIQQLIPYDWVRNIILRSIYGLCCGANKTWENWLPSLFLSCASRIISMKTFVVNGSF